MSETLLSYGYIESPLGELEIGVSDNGLSSLRFVNTGKNALPKKRTDAHPLIDETRDQLQNFFNKKLETFTIPLNLKGTEFQTRVWNQLTNISPGKTISYLELARKLGDEKCIRAAASANGKNPVAIIVPCHRVIGSNNRLVGYSGDLWRKKWLLDHESKQASLFHSESPILGEADNLA